MIVIWVQWGHVIGSNVSKTKSKWPPGNLSFCQFSPWNYGILPQILLELSTNNAGLCQIEDCASITAGRKASNWVYFQLFLLEVIGKFRVTAIEDQFLTRCRRSQILVINIGPNDLKIILYIEETFRFEIILSILLNVCLFVCTRASKLAKIQQGWQFSAAFRRCCF